MRVIFESGLFDEKWYLTKYSDVRDASVDPINHYLEHGWKKLCDPSPEFSTSAYLKDNRDVRDAGINPLLHYILHGRAEGRPISRRRERSDSFKNGASATSACNQRWVLGRIDRVQDGWIVGLLLAPAESHVKPIVTVEGRPVMHVEYPIPFTPASSNDPLKNFGFKCLAPEMKKGAKIELLAVEGEHIHKVASLKASTDQVETLFLRQLALIRDIAQRPGAVAITCWDGSHNPIGRAKVLYDVLSPNRPAVIFSYLFDEFGGNLWSPLHSSDALMVTIPWRRRLLYHRVLRDYGICFDTVWIGKPRLPSFELAAQLCHPQTRLIVDFDDNEEVFSQSDAALNKAYGKASINMSRHVIKRIPARTAASRTLATAFQALLVRHARKRRLEQPISRHFNAASDEHAPKRSHSLDDKLINRSLPLRAKLGFIGTVRSHKNLLGALEALDTCNRSLGLAVQLHVYGDVKPDSYAKELAARGAVVKGMVPTVELDDHLSAMDVIITGFPSASTSHEEITLYQISSKIGDALRLGLPVLVPEGPSVEDLRNTPGVFLFNESTFGEALRQALNYNEPIGLPQEFTVEGAYESFAEAEKAAMTAMPAGEVFSDVFPVAARRKPSLHTPALLVIWKQNDADLYGRRVDQLVRSYKRVHPEHRIVLLELMKENLKSQFDQPELYYSSESSLLSDSSSRKSLGYENDDGVHIASIDYRSGTDLQNLFEEFLYAHNLLPENTVVVVYPVIPSFSHISGLLTPYPKIVDVVDNQLSWAKAPHTVSLYTYQYFCLIRSADKVIFNSSVARQAFSDRGLLADQSSSMLVPNWYELPSGGGGKKKAMQRKGFNVLYSGNMNDRIDWGLLLKVADISNEICLHLIGTGRIEDLGFSDLLERPNVVYHGPRTERDVLEIIGSMDVAIVPHLYDEVSAYMNPIKVHMYAACGLPVVSVRVPGIRPAEGLQIVNSDAEFIKCIQDLMIGRGNRKHRPSKQTRSESALALIAAISELRLKTDDLGECHPAGNADASNFAS